MRTTVFLQDLRCDGEFHDGCQRNCLLFWTEAWLQPAEHDAQSPPTAPAQVREVMRAAQQLPTRRGDRYTYQSTELYDATHDLSRWNIAPWLKEIARGELTIRAFVQIVTETLAHRLFGWRHPDALVGTAERKGDLKLEAGSWVDVKASKETEAELDPEEMKLLELRLAARPARQAGRPDSCWTILNSLAQQSERTFLGLAVLLSAGTAWQAASSSILTRQLRNFSATPASANSYILVSVMTIFPFTITLIWPPLIFVNVFLSTND